MLSPSRTAPLYRISPHPPALQVPGRIVIIGGGYIAVEFAGIFAGLGSEVHLVYRQELPLRGFDEEVRPLRWRWRWRWRWQQQLGAA